MRIRSAMLVSVAGVVVLVGVFSARAQEADLSEEVAAPPELLFAAYDAHVSANDAAAQRWKAMPPAARPAFSSADQAAMENHGCPEGTQLWRRDVLSEVCAPLCASDADCAPEDGRCRILDVADDSTVIGTLLTDDLPAEEHAAWMQGVDPQRPPVMLCDPFWDVEGMSDLPFVEVPDE